MPPTPRHIFSLTAAFLRKVCLGGALSVASAPAANAITLDSFEAFYGPTRILYSYSEDDTRRPHIFGFPQDGLGQAARIEAMTRPRYDDQYYMFFYHIDGRDLFATSYDEAVHFRINDITYCLNATTYITPQISAAASFTDLMNTQTSQGEAHHLFENIFAEEFHRAANAYFAAARPDNEIEPSGAEIENILDHALTQTIDMIEAKHNITFRLQEDRRHQIILQTTHDDAAARDRVTRFCAAP